MKSLNSITGKFLIETSIAGVMGLIIFAMTELQRRHSGNAIWTVAQIADGILLLLLIVDRGKAMMYGMSLWGGTGVAWNIEFYDEDGVQLEKGIFITPQSRLRTSRLISEYILKQHPGRKVDFKMEKVTDIPVIAVKAGTVAGENREQAFGVFYRSGDEPDSDNTVLILAPNHDTAARAGILWVKTLARLKPSAPNITRVQSLQGPFKVLIPRPIRETPFKQ